MLIVRRSVEEYLGAPREMHTAAHPRCVRVCLREDSPMRLSVIGLILTFALGVLVAPLAVDAQAPVKAARIGDPVA